MVIEKGEQIAVVDNVAEGCPQGGLGAFSFSEIHNL